LISLGNKDPIKFSDLFESEDVNTTHSSILYYYNFIYTKSYNLLPLINITVETSGKVSLHETLSKVLMV